MLVLRRASSFRVFSRRSQALSSRPVLSLETRRFYAEPPKGWGNFPRLPEDEEKEKKTKKKEESDDEGKEEEKKEKKGTDWRPFKSPFDMEGGEGKKKKGKKADEDKEDDEDGEDSADKAQRQFLWVVAGLLAGTGAIVWSLREKADEITYIQFQNELLASNLVDHLEVVNKKIVRVFLKPKLGEAPESPYYFTIGETSTLEDDLAESLARLGMTEEFLPVKFQTETDWSRTLIRAMPTTIFVVSMVFMLRVVIDRVSSLRGAGGGGGPGGIFAIGKSNAKLFNAKGKVKVTFKDVAGCEEAKQEVMEFVSFLKNPSRYTQLGAKIPKGALLVGPPGTGKTLLAKAMAGEANVPFYSVSGSDFIEVYGGVGPARVRSLFAQARQNAPCIIFLDEIDAIGRRRGASGAGRNDERENTLNQLLVEMDGFEANKGIVVIAGTNRPDILDPALRRPGRFDRQISIDVPDIKSRVAVFQVHLANIKTEVDRAALAERLSALTPGFSGADIANICNEAALIAARHNQTSVMQKDFEAAIDRVVAGLEKKNKVMSPQEKARVAHHEAGHALVGWVLPHTDPVLKVSIIPRGQAALGFAMQLPEERYIHSIEYLQERMCVLLAGRAAEVAVFGEISSGAQDDLEKVTDLAYSLMLQYGMNKDIGTLSFSERNNPGYLGKPFSDALATQVDDEVKKLVDIQFDRTLKLVQDNIVKLKEIAALLLEKEVISNEDVERILGPKTKSVLPTPPQSIAAGDAERKTADA